MPHATTHLTENWTRPIENTYWLTLREAAELIGRKITNAEISGDVLDDPDDPLHQIIRKDLYKAFESDKVRVFLDRGLGLFELKIENVLYFAFKIDINNDALDLGHAPDDIHGCHINREELEKFLRDNQSSRSNTKYTQRAETKCQKWLVGLMLKGPQENRKKHYRRVAREKFEIGVNAFSRAWKKTIEETETKDWGRPGRRKKSSH